MPVVLVAQGVVAARNFKAKFAHVKINEVGLFGAALHLAQLHHAVDQCRQTVGLVHNDVALLGALFGVGAGQVAHSLGVALYQGQRGAQVVADIGQNVLFQLGAALDLSGHVVEVLGQLADLVMVYNGQLDIIVAGSNLFCTAGKLLHRPGEPPAEQHGKQQIQHQQDQRHRPQDAAQHLGGCGDLCHAGGHDDAVLAVRRKLAHQHLPGGADLHDLVQ